MGKGSFVALALMVAPVMVAPAQAALRPAMVAEDSRLITASKELARQLGELTARNAPVLELRKPALAALVRDAFDPAAIRTMSTGPIEVMNTLQALLGAYEALYRFAAGEPEDHARLMQVQDELTTASIGLLLSGKRTYPAVAQLFKETSQEDWVGESGVQRQGLNQMHEGIALMIEGALEFQSDRAMTAANRTRLIDGLLEELGVVADAMGTTHRGKMAAVFRRYAAEADPASRTRLEQGARLFERKACNQLCKLSG
ncbi:hypothetical protein P1X14_14575 [Sphingomonas sp. AOB5]|uniref:hypothetical protein n=1 Tax=Sphingomonas sp. AOB5 TaxID=3034017 RepID=UPI0023F6BF57|nr:hypothetical protein [Sphingomonas sp. AOB5]MDF7776477.1 hypothetical protein [Sphingomonas sp. AOB5]